MWLRARFCSQKKVLGVEDDGVRVVWAVGAVLLAEGLGYRD